MTLYEVLNLGANLFAAGMLVGMFLWLRAVITHRHGQVMIGAEHISHQLVEVQRLVEENSVALTTLTNHITICMASMSSSEE